MLEHAPFPALLGPDLRQQVRERLSRRRVPAGRALYRPGEAADALYLIESGRVRVFTRERADRERVLQFLGAGETPAAAALRGESLLETQPNNAVSRATVVFADQITREAREVAAVAGRSRIGSSQAGPREEQRRLAGAHFYAYLYRLRLIQRWVLMRSAVPENVAEHSFQVALLTHALCTIGREVFGKDVDSGRAVILALFHDAEEVMTGDIPSPVKHHDPGMLRSVRDIESLASEELLRMVPEPLAGAYRPLLGSAERDPELMRWVKAADALDAYLKCAMEYAVGNREFAVAERQLEAKARAMDMPEVAYFLEHFAPSFRKTLDEITQ